MTIDSKTPIGIAGLGIMGYAFASRLLDAGFPLAVYNRTPERAEPLVARGATRAATPKELAQRASVVIVMVSDGAALEEVVVGKSGVLGAEEFGDRVLINMSTVSPESTERVRAACAERGVWFVDCPVSGSKPQAESGELILLASGEEQAIRDLEPVFSVLGKKTIYAGKAGNGTRLKLAVNLVLAHLAAALAEGVRFSEAVTLDANLLLEVLKNAPALNAGYFQGKGSKTLQHDFTPQFPLKHMLKDVRLAAGLTSGSLPVTEAIEQIFATAAERGHADDDVCAVIEGI